MAGGDLPALKVLVVDDDEQPFARITRILGDLGMAGPIDWESEAQAAMERLLAGHHDLCFLDNQLQAPGGTSLLKAARAAGCAMPVILLLERDSVCDEECVPEMGAQDALYKDSLLPTAMQRSMRHVLAKARIQRQLESSQTKLRQHELELERLKAALDQHAIVSVADAAGNITYANDKFCEISGYERSELIGRNHRLLKSGLHGTAFYADMWATISQGQSWHGEVCNRRKDGSLYWVRGTIVPFASQDGLPSQYVSIRTDISATKAAEEAKRISEERLTRSQAYANIGTWDWNIQTGELYWSERIGPLFGYEGVVETTYENFLNAVHPNDRQQVVDAVTACVERGEKYDIEHRCIWPDGTIRWLLERGDVTRGPDGSPTHMLGVVQDITDRKLAEQKLQASQASLANAQRIAHLGNWDYDLRSGQIQWSSEVYRIFGFEPGSIRPDIQTYYQWVHPDDRDLVREAEARTAREGSGEVVHRIIRPDGSLRYVRLIGELVSSPEGRSLRLMGTVQDISALKQAEEAVRQSESNLSMAQRVAHLGSFDWNPNTDELHWSDEHYRLWGLEPGTAKPNYSLFRLGVHPDDIAQLEALLHAALAGGRLYDCVHRVCRPDGSERVIHGRGEVIFDTAGKPVRMLGTVQDVTELKQAEHKVRDIGERFRALVETTADWIWEVDQGGRYTYASPQVQALLGYAPEEVLGKSPFDFMAPAEAQRVMALFAPIAEKRLPISGLVNRNIRQDGREVVLETSGVPVFGAGGEFRGYRGIDRDITERIVREQLLMAAKEEAEQANQAKSMFLSSMSHELRTPMNAILGFAQLLQMQRDMKPEHAENVGEILKAGRHLLELINEVLDLAKIEAGRLDLVLEPVACCDVINESLNLVRAMAEQYGIQLREDSHLVCPVLFQADRTRLKQVIINLLSNAIKYNRPGGVVTLGMVSAAQEGCVRIEVTDTGPGLSTEEQKELFQPFQRLHAAELGVEGHGIGLAISKRLIEAMGGRIGVESTQGVGSTFWVELALVNAAPLTNATDRNGGGDPANVQEEKTVYRPGVTILYVEDNMANVRLVQNLVATRPDWTLMFAQTAELGLEQAIFHDIDLILLDINLPGMDGYQVLEQLRALERTRSIPVVALTSNASADAVARGKAAGFTDYLTKPLELWRFWDCLDGTLGRGQHADQLEESRDGA